MDHIKVFAYRCRLTLPYVAIGATAFTIAYMAGDACYAVGRFVGG